MVFIYTEKLDQLCREEYNKLVDKYDVSKIINEQEDIALDSFIPDKFDIEKNSHYLFEINNQLHKAKGNSNLFKK